ncbi:MAG: tetratricopeptide repeat protein [Deltaproteobacteria bacterium]|nr:tetratricopeptide repeat protein [Deltaproteobacteria bacterium]
MICPKCGRPVPDKAVICRGCDFILDTDFLGADILDEEHQLRPGQGGVDPAAFNLADAVILGNIDDDSSSFETSDSGFHLKLEQQAARLYVSGRSQAVMSPDAVIAVIDAGEQVRLTPFEKHVLRFIDGRRPVESIRTQAALDEAEVKTALATLADKGVVKVVGRALAEFGMGGDFEVDTAPGVAAKKSPRRVRGTLVGAVVVVGDAADQVIDDAFRTRVRADAPRLDDLAPADEAEGVFSTSDEVLRVPSADIESFERPTDDGRRRPPSAATALRSGGQRAAVNNARAAGHIAADPSAASDGFDEFGDASNLATAVIQQPSLSDESLPPAAPPRRPATGVFGAGRSMLSGLDALNAPVVEDIADSRVAPRPLSPGVKAPEESGLAALARAATAAPAALPSSVDGSESLNDAERAAMTGNVWNDEVASSPSLPAAQPPAGTSAFARRELSTSLSQLLEDDDDEFEPTAAGVEMARRPGSVEGRGGPPRHAHVRDGSGGFDAAATAAVAAPIARPVPGNDAASAAVRAAPRVGPRAIADAPLPLTLSPSPPLSPGGRVPVRPVADQDLFGDGDEFGEHTEGAGLSQLSTGSVRRGAPLLVPPPVPPGLNVELTGPPSLPPSAPGSVNSAESLDSALVIRPAARVAPAVRPRAADPVVYDDDDFMVDPDATQNLPARPKSLESLVRRAPVASVPIAAPILEQPGSRPRRPPTEDMRRKARQLFEQALSEHAAGKLGAARMNVKLATIYDPSEREYQQVLEEWEDRPRAEAQSQAHAHAQAHAQARPEYVVLYEEAQDLEDDGDVDGALDALERGRQLAPEAHAASFHNRIGVILAMRKREFDRAASEIERAIAIDPGNAHYRNNLGKVIARANRRRGAAAQAR